MARRLGRSGANYGGCIFIVGSAVLTSYGFVTGSDCVTSAVRFQEVVLGSIGFVQLRRLFQALM